ncbi:hypothetical protein EDB83DRAFT_2322398 [Lactarius deliciosus]|nr:hypothetical protein EDB83DRAFT_2322398 [Lactarius deliciosus]
MSDIKNISEWKDIIVRIPDVHDTRSDPDDDASSDLESFDEDDMYASDYGDDVICDSLDTTPTTSLHMAPRMSDIKTIAKRMDTIVRIPDVHNIRTGPSDPYDDASSDLESFDEDDMYASDYEDDVICNSPETNEESPELERSLRKFENVMAETRSLYASFENIYTLARILNIHGLFHDIRQDGRKQHPSRWTPAVSVKTDVSSTHQDGGKQQPSRRTQATSVKMDANNIRQDGHKQHLSRRTQAASVKTDASSIRQDGRQQYPSRWTQAVPVKTDSRRMQAESVKTDASRICQDGRKQNLSRRTQAESVKTDASSIRQDGLQVYPSRRVQTASVKTGASSIRQDRCKQHPSRRTQAASVKMDISSIHQVDNTDDSPSVWWLTWMILVLGKFGSVRFGPVLAKPETEPFNFHQTEPKLLQTVLNHSKPFQTD